MLTKSRRDFVNTPPRGEANPGGAGGGVQILSDEDGDDVGGNIALSAYLNGSGGAGETGGHARSNNTAGTLDTTFTNGFLCLEVSADNDRDGAGVVGTISMTGLMLATGGTPNGNGGDVLISGTLLAEPPAGSSNAASGTGVDGDLWLNGAINP